MRNVIIIGVVVVLALLGLLHTPEAILEISATELVNGVKIENMGNVACLVFVNSLEGEQRFDLAIGESVTVTNISQPIEVSAVSKTGIGIRISLVRPSLNLG